MFGFFWDNEEEESKDYEGWGRYDTCRISDWLKA